MATTNPISQPASAPESDRADLLVLLAAMPPEQAEGAIANLSAAFSPGQVLIAAPDGIPADAYPGLRIIPVPATKASVTLTAADFVNASNLAQKNEARAILVLGPESGSLQPTALRDLAHPILDGLTDLAVPCYELPPRAGMVNSAILYPLTRALFAALPRFPQAIDFGMSLRMASRLAAAANRFTSSNQADALLWPVTEASVAGFAIMESNVGPRALPQPTESDVNAILVAITGSLFADIEAKAAFWQRPRPAPLARTLTGQAPANEALPDIGPMLDAFRLAYTNLAEIWSLVLPPNTLLGLKRLSAMDAAAFRMPDNLWARIVFDFLLAYRLRTINRGHLLGAFIPLYLAWVASHVNIIASDGKAERHVEAVAAAFEAEKPYLVARWRWPDRFNP